MKQVSTHAARPSFIDDGTPHTVEWDLVVRILRASALTHRS